MTAAGLFDRRESEEDVNASMVLIMQADERLRRLPESLADVRVGSVLAVEERHTAYERTASRVQALRNVALDNLQLVFRDVLGTDEQRALDPTHQAVSAYPFSAYPSIRAAVEAAATAKWLLQAGTKSARVFRTLQLSYRDTVDRANLAAAFGAPESVRRIEEQRKTRTIARLNELKDSLPALRQKTLGNPPKYTEILRAASRPWTARYAGRDLIPPFIVWKISSAYLHGSMHIFNALSDVRQLEEFVDGHAEFEISPSMMMLAVSLSSTVELVESVDARFAELASHDHASREVPEVTRPHVAEET